MPNLTKIINTKDLPPGKAISATVGNKQIAVFNIAGKYYAIDDECTHAGGPLSEGEVTGHEVTCPWHGAKFDLTNGNVLCDPAYDAVKSYKVVVEGDEIKVEA